MADSQEKIIKDIKAHIKKRGGKYSSWYVGISEDPKNRLFNGHNVDKDKDVWIYQTASSSEIAREIELYFVDDLGTDGGPGGGDDDAKAVYAYKKKEHTDP